MPKETTRPIAATAAKALDKVTLIQERLFEQMTMIYQRGKNNMPDFDSRELFLLRAAEIDTLREDFKTACFEIHELESSLNPDIIFSSEKLNAFDELYFEVKLSMSKLKALNAPATVKAESKPTESRPRLPKIELYQFDGNIECFTTFYETFCSLVHDQASIPKIDKFHYLISCTSGPALNIVKSVPITADNYDVVWKCLLDKYQDNRMLVGRYLDKMLNFSPLSKETAENLNTFIETFEHSYKAINSLKIDNLTSYFFCHIALRALDPQTRKLFEQSLDQKSIPNFSGLVSFVRKQIKVLDHSASYAPTSAQLNKQNKQLNNKSYTPKPTQGSFKNNFSHASATRAKLSCSHCGENHMIFRCDQFRKLTSTQRISRANALKLCYNCLKNNHMASECKSDFKCFICQQPHHVLLHSDCESVPGKVTPALKPAVPKTVPVVQSTSSAGVTNKNITSCHASSMNEQSYVVILGTAVVHAVDAFGNEQACRVLIDSGAQSNFITVDCLQRLGLAQRKCPFNIYGLGGESVKNHGMTSCKIKPRHTDNPIFKLDAIVLPKITSDLPTVEIPEVVKNKYSELTLADPGFHKRSAIDIILAGDIFPHIYDGSKRDFGQHVPTALSSIFGYIIAGRLELGGSNNMLSMLSVASTLNLVSYTVDDDSINERLKSFWELECLPCEVPSDPLEKLAEDIFLQKHYREPSGRYVSPMLLNPTSGPLGDSYTCALRRFLQLERRLLKMPEFHKAYIDFMREYESLGHMEVYSGLEESKYLIPHHGVIRLSSTTTPVRVVFDGSAKTDTGLSLNDTLLTGKKLHHDILKIIINFRLYDICFTADITKFYRQCMILPSEREYQHILWREEPSEPIRTYELKTNTYGLRSATYVAVRTLHQLAHDEQANFPLASSVLLQGFFVDDLLWSTQTLSEACTLQDELLAILRSGGFELNKWASNTSQLLKRVQADQAVSINFQDDTLSSAIKILGLKWIPSQDCFSFNYNLIDSVSTKRSVLKLLASIFDPVGFIAPCTFVAKCIMQDLWKLSLGWDEQLPTDVRDKWQRFISALPVLSQLRIERHLLIPKFEEVQLIAFCDASSRGYAACIYLRSTDSNGSVKVRLLASKSKVAPIKPLSIPRLELMAALLLARLVNFVFQNIAELNPMTSTSNVQVVALSDSSITLSWLQIPPYKLKTFVSSRVAKIIEKIAPNHWFHVNSENNAADICSRGVMPEQLVEGAVSWFHGPEWLRQDRKLWPVSNFFLKNAEEVPEQKTSVDTFALTSQVSDKADEKKNDLENVFSNFSSFTRLQRVMAWCHRFIKNSKLKLRHRYFGVLTTTELNTSHDSIIKCVQQNNFSTENEPSLKRLSPFYDDHGFFRVGGRLAQSDLPYNSKHPLLLPKRSHVTHLIIDHYHKKYLHAGPRTTQGLISQKYWIICARGSIRSRLSKCVLCFRCKPIAKQPLMGSLPSARLKPEKVFNHVGCDIGGPFYIKESLKRNAKITKAYLCLFVCFSTKAVHLEVLSELSADCFLATLDRFVARRGLCSCLYSDCGTNFIAAAKHLKEVCNFFLSQDVKNDILNGCAQRQIEWHFNPPNAPNMGGLWEAGIKSAKYHLTRAVADSSSRAFTFEELSTIFCRAEAIMNSRPLCELSNSPNEFDVLTCGHFLIGQSLLAVPERNIDDLALNRLSRWQCIQRASQTFWKRWSSDYVHTLQQRAKWFTTCNNLKVGDLVILKSDLTRPLQWPLGRVEQLHPGKDNIVRVVTVRTSKSLFKRPVGKLCPLPNSD